MAKATTTTDTRMAFDLTALSCACALGRTNDEVLASLNGGVSGLKEISGDIPSRPIYFGMVPGELPPVPQGECDMRSSRLLVHAVDGMRGEIDSLLSRFGEDRVAIVIGASNTGIDEAQRNVDAWLDSGVKPTAMDFSMIELGTPSLFLARLLGVKGPAFTISTACSSSAKVFSSARRLMEAGYCDAAIVGGVDGRCRFAMNGFHALGALAQGKCRPLAPDRDGINLGEGVALFTMERDAGRGVVFAGAGETSDAWHATAPDPEGRGAEAAMKAALEDAGITPDDVAYLNLHGTGTMANDEMEMKAVRRVFKNLPQYESTKSLTGHCLGAAGAIEAAICWLKISTGAIHGATLSNSFAFGGSNASVVLSPIEAHK